MVGAFPEAGFVVSEVRAAVLVASPEPFALFSVNDVCGGVLPAAAGNAEGFRVAEVLVEVDMADDALAQYPPLPLRVRASRVGPVFVHHRAVRLQSLVGGPCDSLYRRLHSLEQGGVSQLQCGLVQQPYGFDVVSEALDVAPSLPAVIEEEVEVAGLRIEQPCEEDVDQIGDPLRQLRCPPHPVEVGVRLEDVQVRVHGARPVLVLVAQPHIGDGLPVARQRLDVAVVPAVEGVAFDVAVQLLRIVQCLAVAGGTCVFAQSVDGESDGVGLLPAVEHVSLCIQAPEDTALLGIDETVDEIVSGPCGCLQVFRPVQDPVGGGESPEDAGVEDGSLFGIRHGVAAAVYPSEESAVAAVGHPMEPERQDVLFQLPAQFFR